MTHALFSPMLALLLLLLIVWCYMFYQRISYIMSNKIDVQQAPTRNSTSNFYPERICGSADNFQNLTELPPFFLALCILYIIAETQWQILTPNWVILTAYGYVASRALHSLIHCTYNNVNHRFALYAISCLCLWAMVLNGLNVFI